jgi:hypothetical protein
MSHEAAIFVRSSDAAESLGWSCVGSSYVARGRCPVHRRPATLTENCRIAGLAPMLSRLLTDSELQNCKPGTRCYPDYSLRRIAELQAWHRCYPDYSLTANCRIAGLAPMLSRLLTYSELQNCRPGTQVTNRLENCKIAWFSGPRLSRRCSD